MLSKKTLLISILLLGLFLRLYHVAYQSYWIDELVSVHFSSHPLWQALLWDNHFIVYPLILKGWISLGGDSEFATRSLSVVFSIASLSLLTLIFENKKTALVAVFLMAINPLSILMAQETRPYALLELLVLIMLWRALKFQQLANQKNIIWLLFTIAIGVMTHYLFVIPALYLLGYFILKTKNQLRKIIFTGLSFIVAVLIISIISWDPLEWQKYKFAQGDFSLDYLQGFLKVTAWTFFIYLPFILTKSAKPLITFENAIHLFTPVLFIGLFISGLIVQRNFALDRYFIIAVPFFVYSVALGFETFWQNDKKFFYSSVVVLGLISVVISSQNIYQNIKAPWRELAQTFSEFSPCPEILTTRSLAINTPYFQKLNCEVKKLESIDQIKNHILQTKKPIYIVDNYWGATPYLLNLQSTFEKEEFAQVDIKVFQKKQSDILYLVKISPRTTPAK